MRLYALNKRQFGGVFIVFFMCFGITVLIGVAGMLHVVSSVLNTAHACATKLLL